MALLFVLAMLIYFVRLLRFGCERSPQPHHPRVAGGYGSAGAGRSPARCRATSRAVGCAARRGRAMKELRAGVEVEADGAALDDDSSAATNKHEHAD